MNHSTAFGRAKKNYKHSSSTAGSNKDYISTSQSYQTERLHMKEIFTEGGTA